MLDRILYLILYHILYIILYLIVYIILCFFCSFYDFLLLSNDFAMEILCFPLLFPCLPMLFVSFSNVLHAFHMLFRCFSDAFLMLFLYSFFCSSNACSYVFSRFSYIIYYSTHVYLILKFCLCDS